MTIWIYRWHLLVEIAEAESANALWTLVAPNGDAEARTFLLPVSADGITATHYATSTAATEEMRVVLDELRAEGLLGGALLVEQHYTAERTLDVWLAELGMQRIAGDIDA